MDWHDEVRSRLQKKNQILFVKDCAFLQELNSFLRIQNHRTVVLWAFDLAEESIEVLAQNYPIENVRRRHWTLQETRQPAESKCTKRSVKFWTATRLPKKLTAERISRRVMPSGRRVR